MTKFAYVIFSGVYSSTTINGVFLDKEKAEEIVNKLNKKYDERYPPRKGFSSNDEFYIQEYEIDQIEEWLFND